MPGQAKRLRLRESKAPAGLRPPGHVGHPKRQRPGEFPRQTGSETEAPEGNDGAATRPPANPQRKRDGLNQKTSTGKKERHEKPAVDCGHLVAGKWGPDVCPGMGALRASESKSPSGGALAYTASALSMGSSQRVLANAVWAAIASICPRLRAYAAATAPCCAAGLARARPQASFCRKASTCLATVETQSAVLPELICKVLVSKAHLVRPGNGDHIVKEGQKQLAGLHLCVRCFQGTALAEGA